MTKNFDEYCYISANEKRIITNAVIEYINNITDNVKKEQIKNTVENYGNLAGHETEIIRYVLPKLGLSYENDCCNCDAYEYFKCEQIWMYIKHESAKRVKI